MRPKIIAHVEDDDRTAALATPTRLKPITSLTVILLIFFICSGANCWGCEKTFDILIYGDAQGWIAEEPIYQFFLSQAKRRFNRTRFSYSSASWEISNGELYLTSFTGTKCGKDTFLVRIPYLGKYFVHKPIAINLKQLFPGSKGKVFAVFYTGKIHLSLGRRIDDFSGVYPICERLIVFQIKNGVVMKSEEYIYPKNYRVFIEHNKNPNKAKSAYGDPFYIKNARDDSCRFP